MSCTPRVSVVVPCYNYETYLDAAVRSALGQEGVVVDVTIVDDCSTDGSLEIASRWEQADERVRLMRNPENRGHIATFNRALSSARSPYVVKLDPDDLLPPGALRRAASVLEAHPDVTFTYGRSIQFEGVAPVVPDTRSLRVKRWSGQQWLWRRARGGVNFIAQPEVMIRRTALEAAGGHREEIPEASDYHLWLRLAALGSVARIQGPVQGLYRIHPQSMQRTIHAGALSDLRARTKVFDMFIAEQPDAVTDPEAFRRRAHRTLSREAVLRALDAFDNGTAETVDVTALAGLATDLDPTVTRTLAWRELQHRLHVGRTVATPRLAPSSLLRRNRWNHRVRWAFRYQK